MSLPRCVNPRFPILFALLLGGLWSALAAPPPAAAQVNTETQRIGADAEDGFHGDLKGDLALKRGNVNLFQVGTGAKAFYQTGIHTPMIFGRAEYGEEDNAQFSKLAFLHARWTAMWHERIGSELFGQIEYNENIKMKFRGLLGAGARLMLVKAAWIESYFGTGYMFEREVLSFAADEDPGNHPLTTDFHRWTSYLSVTVALNEILDFSSVTYVQPRFSDFGDTRVLENADLSVQVSERFSLVNTLSLRIDTRPPKSVKKTDLGLTVGVRLNY